MPVGIFSASVDRLPVNELALFTAVSVFSGGFATDTVDAVAGPELEDGASTLMPLRALVDKSLLQIDHGAGRYRMLETLRQYAAEQLHASPRPVAFPHGHGFAARTSWKRAG